MNTTNTPFATYDYTATCHATFFVITYNSV